MKAHIEKMIVEYGELYKRIQKLDNYIYSSRSASDNRVEFANKCIQLKAMRVYAEALETRLQNAGIVFADGQYLEHVASIPPSDPVSVSDTDAPEKDPSSDIAGKEAN